MFPTLSAVYLYINRSKTNLRVFIPFNLVWAALCIWSISYQNSFFYKLNPGFYLKKQPISPKLTQSQLQRLKTYCFDRFSQLFDFEKYKKLSDKELLTLATIDSQNQLNKYGTTYVSNLSKIKTMAGLPRLFGFAYGGIAYHDLITGEIVIPSKSDYPSTTYFRAKMIYHEVGHSLYYSDDIQNNIFQTQAMLNSKNKTIQSLAYLMILSYTDFPLFESLKTHQGDLYSEFVTQGDLNKKQFSKYYCVKFLKNLFVKSNIQNKASKYGYSSSYLNNIFLRNIHTVLTPSLLYLESSSEFKEK